MGLEPQEPRLQPQGLLAPYRLLSPQRLAHSHARKSRRRTVYMSAAANALRVAKTAPSLEELVRIATGEPKADAAPDVPEQDAAVRGRPGASG